MPLRGGDDRGTVSYNISELMGAYEEKGKIGHSRPANKKKALKQAQAIALDKARESKR